MINLCPVRNSTTDLGRLGDGCNRYRCRPSVVRPHCIAKIVVSPLSTPTPRHSLPVTNLALSLSLCFCLSLSHSSQLQDVRTRNEATRKKQQKRGIATTCPASAGKQILENKQRTTNVNSDADRYDERSVPIG